MNKNTIESIIHRINNHDFEKDIMIVDGSSSDDTISILKTF